MEQKAKHLRVGELGEQIAERYLRDHGYTIVGRNYKDGYGRNCRGEIDLIAIYQDVVYFVEVKCRSGNTEFGDFSPEAAFTKEKISRIKCAAQSFIGQNHLELDIAFSLVAINLPNDNSAPIIRFYNDIRL